MKIRKIFLAVVSLLALAYIVFSITELEHILSALRQSKPVYLAVAAGVEAMLLLNTTATFWALYRLEDLHQSKKSLLLSVTAATFVNIVTPSYGIGGLAVFIDEARQYKLSTGRVLVAGILYVIYEFISLFLALSIGFVFLARLGKLNLAELLAAGFLVALAVAIGTGLMVGFHSTRKLGDILAWFTRGINRLARPLLHRELLEIQSAYTFSNDLTEGLEILRNAKPGQILLPLVFTVLNKILLILALAMAFLAMGWAVSPTTLVAGFSVGHLFVYASPTPSGIGFVDSILPLALNSLAVPLPQAVLVTLIYRAVTLWLPLILGAAALRALQHTRMRNSVLNHSS